MRILIVDDHFEKAQSILQVLQMAEIEAVQVVHESTGLAARKQLRKQSFDLLIIDLHLPLGLDSQPNPDGGIRLFEMLCLDSEVNLPPDVLFITGREELVDQAREQVASVGGALLEYTADNERWKSHLIGKAKYIARRIDREPRACGVDIAIVTALRSPELDAVLNLPYGWEKRRFADDPTVYHFGAFERGQEQVRFVAAHATRKGMPSSSALASKMLTVFRPKYVVMLGICAGIPEKTNLGDVVVGDPTWDYGSGKRSLDENSSPVFLSAPYQMALKAQVSQLALELGRDPDVLKKIRTGWDGDAPAGRLTVHVGPMASGASVIADDAESRKIGLQHREVLAIEMEAYAVMAATEYCSGRDTSAIAIKSVCDYADAKKSDSWQAYASYTSAAFADQLFRSEFFDLGR